MPPIRGISIIIPAYNAAGTIVESIASVVAAAREIDAELEVVVVDDGSTDGTAAVVASEFGTDARVRVFAHRCNRGGAAARNSAVGFATNEWIFCLDSDNLLDPASLGRMVAMAATGQWDVVAPAEMRFFRESPERPTHLWFWDRPSLEPNDALQSYETPVACGNYLFTLDVWARAGGYPEFAGSLDAWGFGVRLLFEGARFGVCPDVFYLHRQGHESYYIRDDDAGRAVAAAQILLPYVSRLTVRDQKRLLADGELLEYFAQIPTQPLTVEGSDATGSGGRIVVGGREVRGGAARPPAPAARGWADSPKAALRRLKRAFARRGPASDR